MKQKKLSKSSLAVILSRLEGFSEHKVNQEQYETDSEIAAEVLWNAYLAGDLEGKVAVDLGCGPGMLGIGALIMGAGKAIFIDIDKNALKTAKNNILQMKSERLIKNKAEFIEKDIKDLEPKNFMKVDLVLQNPPFGTKIGHIDRVFLEKSLEIAPLVYSFHKSETLEYLKGFLAKKNAKITRIWSFEFPLKMTQRFHRRQIHRIKVSCIRVEKIL